MTKTLLTLRLVLATLVASALVMGAAVAAARPWTPPPDTVVKVEGNARDGFGIYFYDGSTMFPPTGSEARAECGEYDQQLDRVRCRVATRQWYRDLGAMKRAIRYARFTR
jgi:hypothetical protein